MFQNLPALDRLASLSEGAGTGTLSQRVEVKAATVQEAAQCAALSVREYATAYFELAKPRVLTMVLITTLAGFYMGCGEEFFSARICARWSSRTT